jgi:hypothetical protein
MIKPFKSKLNRFFLCNIARFVNHRLTQVVRLDNIQIVNRRALFGEEKGGGFAYATGCACDEKGFVVKHKN